MAHFAICGLMHKVALQAGQHPDELSFLHAVRVIRRKMAADGSSPLGRGRPFIKQFFTKCSRNASRQAETGAISAGASAR